MHNIEIRNATQDDAKDLFFWRNDPITRQMFFNTAPVLWEDHVDWLTASLVNATRTLLIATIDDKKVGTIRFDLEKNIASISININPTCRGENMAVEILLLAQDYAPKEAQSLRAEIKRGNTASLKTFERAGYALQTEDDKNAYYAKNIKVSA